MKDMTLKVSVVWEYGSARVSRVWGAGPGERERPEWRERDGGEERDRGLRDRRYHTLSGTLAPEMDTVIKLQFVFT